MAQIVRKQSSIENLISDLTALRGVDATLQLQQGSLSLLTTDNKTDLVHSINEVDSHTDTNSSNITTINTLLGSSFSLQTTAQNIIQAINEVKTHVDTVDSESLKKADNLASLSNKTTARTNLQVFSQTEVQNLIYQSEINLGTNYSVANIAARNALTGLTIGDNVFVTDAGDGKWAIDKVVGITGGNPVFERIMDKDVYLNSISKEAIKGTYESNPDTNAFTDAAETKVNYLTVTSAINLDKVIQNDELNTSTTLANATNTDIASSLAVKTFVNNTTLKVANNLNDLSNKATARLNLDVYNRYETEQLLLNAAFGGITVEDIVNMQYDIEKAKKNYFFGLEMLGSLRV
jgi:hypothetical protein